MKIDWLEKLRVMLQTWAFCLAVSAIQQAFQSDRPYELPLVYSMCIGTMTWAIVDLGRELFPSAHKPAPGAGEGPGIGWPTGVGAVILPFVGIVGGYVLGTLAGDSWFGWSSWDEHPAARAQLPVSIIVTGLAGVAGVYYFYSQAKALWLEKQAQASQRLAAESKLKLLQAQIEPHMLFNTLANLRALIATDPPRALTMLDHLNSYLRATLGASRTTSHPLQTEFDRLRDYLELMAVRMGPRLAYTLALPPGLAMREVPPLLLQPLVENAIKHGLEPSVAGGAISVRAEVTNGQLVLTVQDNGMGLQDASFANPSSDQGSAHGGSFGLAQVRERLTTLYGDRAGLELSPSRGPLQAGNVAGTLARIHLPLD